MGFDPAPASGDVPPVARALASIDEAAQVMRDRAIRRIPVVRDGAAVGIVSIGDLAREKDPNSALAEISAAPANN